MAFLSHSVLFSRIAEVIFIKKPQSIEALSLSV